MGDKLTPTSGSVRGGLVPGTMEKLKCWSSVAKKIGITELANVIPMQILFPKNITCCIEIEMFLRRKVEMHETSYAYQIQNV